MVDPRTSPQIFNYWLVGGDFQKFRRSDSANERVFAQPLVHTVQKFLAVIVVMFPGILAVQNDGNEVWSFCPLSDQLLTNGVNAVDKIGRRHFPWQPGIGKANLVRND